MCGSGSDRRRRDVAGRALRRRAGALALAAGLAADAAWAQSALQVTPDGKRTLINKQVGDERWAITLNADDATVTGNVSEAGGSAAFLFCTPGLTTDREDVALSCQSAPPCTVAPCPGSQWTFADDVALPLSFFAPPAGPTPTPVPTAALSDLRGLWQFDYAIAGGSTAVYELVDVLYQFGRPVLTGHDATGFPVNVAYPQPGAAPQYEFALLAVAENGCLLTLFRRDGAATIAGIAFPVGRASDGSCLGIALGQTPVEVSGFRLPTDGARAAPGPAVDASELQRLIDVLQPNVRR
ncbi:MAG TPA: hypothetical protein VFD92_05240 [Candidatus Binatia bacterium]|nr:hypothetical protein [Candidatus Binatia bacterium]